jgi:hypothetical protein
METPILYKSHMQFEHQQWKREIAFWTEELKSFNNRLNELSTYWENKKGLFQIAYYKDKFELQRKSTVDLLETIEERENQVPLESEVGTIISDTQLLKGHIEFRNKMNTQRELYAELKRNYFKFFDKYV